MGISPQEIMEENEFTKKMAEYVKKAEEYIDIQLRSRYDSFLEEGKIDISEYELNAHLFCQKKNKNLPIVIRMALLSGLSSLYPNWDISEEKSYVNSEKWLVFRPKVTKEEAKEEVVEEAKEEVVEEDISSIENRSELLDLGEK